MKLTNYFIKKQVQALAATPGDRMRRFCKLEDAREVMVLFEWTDREDIEMCLKKLRTYSKHIVPCMYMAEEKDPQANSSYILIREKVDLDVWYKPKQRTCERFNKVQADILIDLTKQDCYPMHYLLLQHPAGLKVGIRHEGIDLYDLTILVKENKDVKQLFEHILFYLCTIRSK